MNKLVIVSGIPGSGKSSWIRGQISKKGGIHISRDQVRYSLLAPNDEYFKKDKDVFRKFINKIQDALDTNDLTTIYVDATHLTKKSRAKVLNALRLDKDTVIEIIQFDVPLKVCIARNNLRTGRKRVPEETIADMFLSLEEPTEDEAKIIKFVKNGW